jgi:nicotinamidase-related amidase
MRALLVIDVTDVYLNDHKPDYDDIPVFIQGIVNRVSQGQDALVLFFTDFSSANFPQEFSPLLDKHGPAIWKVGFSAFDYKPIDESELHDTLQNHGITTVEVCGLYCKWCVAETCTDALSLGYEVLLNPAIVLGENGKIRPDLAYLENEGAVLI